MIKQSQWISWLAATATATVILVSFVYQTFSTKSEANEIKNGLERRLDRIESKIDRIIEAR